MFGSDHIIEDLHGSLDNVKNEIMPTRSMLITQDYIAIVWYHQIDTKREHQTLLEQVTYVEGSYRHVLMIQTM